MTSIHTSLRSVLIWTLALTTLSGCSWFTTVKRYQNIQKTTIDEKLPDQVKPDAEKKVFMDFSHAAIDSPSAKPSFKTLWDLQGPGQKALIRALDSNSKGPDAFISSLSNKYLKGEDDATLDFTKKRIKLVFSVGMWHPYEQLGDDDKGFSEADRIEYLNYTFKLHDKNLHFANWDRYQTNYATINIADLSFQTSVSGTLGYGDSTSGLSAGVTASGSRTENQHIQYRYIQLQGTLHDDNLQLTSQGTRELNLEGNQTVDVTIKFEPQDKYLFGLDGIKKDDGTLKKPGELDLQVIYATVPREAKYDSIAADLTYTYAYRHVRKRPQKTFGEFDDKLRYYTGTANKKVTLLLPREIFPKFFYIYQPNPDVKDTTNRKLRLQVARPHGAGPIDQADLLFPDKKSADAFLEWLFYYPASSPAEEKQSIEFKNHYTLMIGDTVMTRAKLRAINASPNNYLQTARYYQTN